MRDRMIGIVDVGGARCKAAVYQLEEVPRRSWEASAETGDLVTAGQAEAVRAELSALIGQVRDRADRVVAYGAGLLRQPGWRDELMPMLTDQADEAFVLDAHEEGRLLLLAARRSGHSADHLVDIGGESVQLITEPASGETAEVSSWPVGTFAIERRWVLPQGSPIPAYEAAAADLRDVFALTPSPGGRLALGTGLMAAFLERLAPNVDVARADRWSVADLERGWRFCAGLPQERFGEVFPTKPGFMYGADKAMLVAWVVASALGITDAHGTAASVMDGVAWSAADRHADV